MNPGEAWTPYRDTKFCFVPDCKNSSKNSQKTFFGVPKATKQEWCDAVGVECPNRFLYVCEDHLNPEEDIENYMYWRTMKVRAKLKSCVPQSLIKAPPSTEALNVEYQLRPGM